MKIHRWLAGGALALFAGAPASAQIGYSSANLPHEWAAGLRFHLELNKSRTERKGDEILSSTETLTPIQVEILERTTAGYLYRWTNGETSFGEFKGDNGQLMRSLAAFQDGLALVLRADETGSPTSVENLDEARRYLTGKLDEARKAALARGEPREMVERMIQAVAASIQGPTLETTLLRDPVLYYMPSAGTFVVNEKAPYDVEIPNPWGGGDMIPCKAYFLLKEVRLAKEEADVEWKQVIDPERGRPAMLRSIKSLAKRLGRPEPTEADLDGLSTEDGAIYVYDLRNGLPKSVQQERVTLTGPQRRIERARFELKQIEDA